MKILVWNLAKPKEAAPVFAYGLAKGLVENGIEVYALMQEGVPNKAEWDKLLDSQHIYYTHSNNTQDSHLKQIIDFYTVERQRIKQFFRNVELDYSISTVFANWSIFFEPLIKAKCRVAVCHDPIPHSGEKRINAWLAKRFYEKHDKLIVLTEKFVKPAEKRYNKRQNSVISIKHGRSDAYTNKINVEISKEYDTNKINFLFFGRIEKYKGLGVLGEAYKDLCKKHKNVTLTVAGNGDFSEFEELYSTLERTRLIIRYIDDDEVGGLFSGPNIVAVVPYIDATQSGIISIAFEFGVPVIASNTGGLKEQLDNGKIGVFFEKGNAKELSRKMEYFIDRPETFKEQSDLERQYIRKLDWDIVTKDMLHKLEDK